MFSQYLWNLALSIVWQPHPCLDFMSCCHKNLDPLEQGSQTGISRAACGPQRLSKWANIPTKLAFCLIYITMWPADTKCGFCAAREAKFLYNVALEDIWVWDPCPRTCCNLWKVRLFDKLKVSPEVGVGVLILSLGAGLFFGVGFLFGVSAFLGGLSTFLRGLSTFFRLPWVGGAAGGFLRFCPAFMMMTSQDKNFIRYSLMSLRSDT